MALFTNGQYKILSAQFPNQAVTLIEDGLTNVIAGCPNSTSLDQVWTLTNVGTMGNQFTLANDGPTCGCEGGYASVSDIAAGEKLRGGSSPVTWTAVGSCTAGQYWIFAPSASDSSVPSGLTWYLANGNDETPITLEPFCNSGNSLQSRQGGSVSSAFDFARWK